MKVNQIASSVLLLSTATLVSAVPGSTLDARADSDSCFLLDYAQDRNGKNYGGSYDSCSKPFEQWYPEPVYSTTDPCWVTAYQRDNCGNLYGGAYNSCRGAFQKYYKKPKCKKNPGHGKPSTGDVSQSNICGNNITVYCCNSDGSGAISSSGCSAVSGSSVCSVTIVCCNANKSIQYCAGSITLSK